MRPFGFWGDTQIFIKINSQNLSIIIFSGNRVLFHHFPEFKPHHGGFGDTLVWDAFLNRLFIQSEYEEYEGLCYRYFQNGT